MPGHGGIENNNTIIFKKMKRKIIKTTKDYQEVLLWIDEMFDKKIQPNTKEGKQLQRALLSVKKFEDVFYAVPLPN